MDAFAHIDRSSRGSGAIYTPASCCDGRRSVEVAIWRKRKHGYVRRCQAILHNGIAVARVHTSSMLANTCCTTLLMQGAPAESTACPG